MPLEALHIRKHMETVVRAVRLPEDDNSDDGSDKITDESMAETLRSYRSELPENMKQA
jgi:erythromycin esterase-like protein